MIVQKEVPADGCVNFEDLMIFAITYSSIPYDPNWNLLCNIASDGGILQPDGFINFEGLMIFEMHYGECDCTPPSTPTLSDPGSSSKSPATYAVNWSTVSEATSYKFKKLFLPTSVEPRNIFKLVQVKAFHIQLLLPLPITTG